MRRITTTLALLLALSTTARADWPAGGKLVSTPGDINGVSNAVIIDLPGGDLGVLGIGEGGSARTYDLQRIGRDGVLRAGWPANGVGLVSIIRSNPIRWQGLAVDDAGFLWHSYYGGSSGMMAQFVGPDLEGAGTTFALSPGTPSIDAVRVATAPNGDAFVVSGNRLRRITRTGALATGWTSTGVTLPNQSYEDTALLPDGAGGVLVFMRSGTGGFPSVTRIDGNGVRHAGWPAAGRSLVGAVPPFVPVIADYNSQMIPSGADHFIAAWMYPTATTGVSILALQRFDIDGTIDPGWADAAIGMFNPGSFKPMNLIPDGDGGVYVVRPGDSGPAATHIAVTGSLLGAMDTPLNLPGDQYIQPTVYLSAPDAQIADRTPNGGLLVGWNDARLAPTVSFRLRWWNPDLTPDASKPDTGLVYLPNSPHPYAGALLAVHADGPDGAFLAWGDYHQVGPFSTTGDLWMARTQVPALASVTPRPAAPALTLSAPRPNPARGAFAIDVTLADGSPARVELLDVAGRIVRAQLVQGAGTHAVRFDDLGTLEPGLYFVRAANRSATRSTRFVLTR